MPSHDGNSFLIRFSASQWTARKMDKPATRDAREKAGASEKAGVKVYKSIIAAKELDAIQQIVSAARDEHEKRTVPWAYKGPGAITAEGYAGYKAVMADYESKFFAAVSRFLDVYERERSEARGFLGTMFNPADYPTVDELRGKFGFSIHVEPFPNAATFQPVGLPPEVVAQVQADITRHTEQALANANATAWERVIDRVTRLRDRLSEYTSGEVTKFYETWVTNIDELVQLLPSINVANDPELKRMGQKLKMLTAYSIASLKESAPLRGEVVRQATLVLDGITAAHARAA